jgi:hypothetical protein
VTRAIATRITVLGALLLSTSYASEAQSAAAFLKCDYEVRATYNDSPEERQSLTEYFSFEDSQVRVLDSDGWIDIYQQCASVQPAAIIIEVGSPDDIPGCGYTAQFFGGWFVGKLHISRVDGSISGSGRFDGESYKASGKCAAVPDPLTSRAF